LLALALSLAASMYGFSFSKLILGLLFGYQSVAFAAAFADMYMFICVDIKQCKCPDQGILDLRIDDESERNIAPFACK
jgi:hypothetical protein